MLTDTTHAGGTSDNQSLHDDGRCNIVLETPQTDQSRAFWIRAKAGAKNAVIPSFALWHGERERLRGRTGPGLSREPAQPPSSRPLTGTPALCSSEPQPRARSPWYPLAAGLGLATQRLVVVVAVGVGFGRPEVHRGAVCTMTLTYEAPSRPPRHWRRTAHLRDSAHVRVVIPNHWPHSASERPSCKQCHYRGGRYMPILTCIRASWFVLQSRWTKVCVSKHTSYMEC